MGSSSGSGSFGLGTGFGFGAGTGSGSGFGSGTATGGSTGFGFGGGLSGGWKGAVGSLGFVFGGADFLGVGMVKYWRAGVSQTGAPLEGQGWDTVQLQPFNLGALTGTAGRTIDAEWIAPAEGIALPCLVTKVSGIESGSSFMLNGTRAKCFKPLGMSVSTTSSWVGDPMIHAVTFRDGPVGEDGVDVIVCRARRYCDLSKRVAVNTWLAG